jgi:hypothetical protein
MGEVVTMVLKVEVEVETGEEERTRDTVLKYLEEGSWRGIAQVLHIHHFRPSHS